MEFRVDADGCSLPGVVSRKCDIWAVGCILFKVAATDRASAFANDYGPIALKQQSKDRSLPQLSETHNESLRRETMCPEEDRKIPLWKQVNAVLKLCFALNPEERASAFELSRRFDMMRSLVVEAEIAEKTNVRSRYDVDKHK